MSHGSAGVASAAAVRGLTKTLTVPSGKVASDQTAFVVRVNLADLPTEWWRTLRDDLGSIRVYTGGGTRLPVDVLYIDLTAKTGEMYFRGDVANAGSTFSIKAVPDTTQDAAGDTYGRNAVWADYDWVGSFFEDGVDRTSGGHDAAIEGLVAGEFGVSVTVNSSDGHWTQGVAYDGTNWYSSTTDELRKMNGSYTQTAINSTPHSAAGLSTNHIGDIAIKGGELFAPMETYPSGPYVNQWIGVFNVSDLSFNRKYDISAQGHELSAITWNNDAGYWVVTSFDGPGDPKAAKLMKYDASWNYLGDLTLPVEITYKQGIVWKSGVYYIMQGPHAGSSSVWKVATDMSSAAIVYTSGTTALEGLELVGNDLYYISTGGVDHLSKLPYLGTTGEVGWITLAGGGDALVSGLHKRTAWTMGCTVKISAIPSANRGILSYTGDVTGSNSNRASLLARSTGVWTIWNSSDTFQNGSAIVSGDVGARRRLHHTQNTTVDRKIWLQGAVNGTDTGAAQRPAGGSDGAMYLYIGAEDNDHAERFDGKIGGIIYLRNGVMSADWLAAEQLSWEGSTFYTIT